MSQKERDRLKVVSQVVNGTLYQWEAAELLDLTERQVRRLVRRYEREKDAGLVHRLRGRPSNRKLAPALQEQCVALIAREYRDYGPTLASEALAKDHGITVSRETLRKWMMDAKVWRGRTQRVVARQWRERKACVGELVQMDTSIHDWFEGRGEQAVLIAMIDDASSRLLIRFYPQDSTSTNMMLLMEYIRRNGRPKAIYADRASHFVTTRQPSIDEDLAGQCAHTQIQRALGELDIEYIAARSPQAKGRVERLFKTLQDRLVKALRKNNIATIGDANGYLDHEFIPDWNRRFTVEPASHADAHRSRKGFDLHAIFSVQHKRTVANDYTIQHHNARFQILKTSIKPGLRRSRIVVENRLDGSQRLRWKKTYLRFMKIVSPNAGKNHTSLGVSPVGLRPPSDTPKEEKPRPRDNHPWKKSYKTGHF
jgi:transposase-like protein